MTRTLLCLLCILMLLPLWASASDAPEMYTEEYDLMLENQELERWKPLAGFTDTPSFEVTWFSSSTPVSEDVFVFRLMNKLFNMKFKPVLRQPEDLLTMLAAGDVPDVIALDGDSTSIANIYDQGLLAAIPEETFAQNMPQYYADLMKTAPNSLLGIKNEDGTLKAIPLVDQMSSIPIPAAIRADWLKAAGWDRMPKTLDELEEVFVAFVEKDPDGNQLKDTFALSMGSDQTPENWFQSIFGAYGINPFYWTENEKGELELGFTTDQFVQAMIRLNKWYKMGLIDPEFVTDIGRSLQPDLCLKFSTGRIGYVDNISFDDLQWDNDGNLNAKWMANNGQWLDWFLANNENKELIYSTQLQTDFNPEIADPYYIALAPLSTDYSDGVFIQRKNVRKYLVFGKQILDEAGKLEKVMQSIDYQAVDPVYYITVTHGPQGIFWGYDEAGKIVTYADAQKHAHYSNAGAFMGNQYVTGHLINTLSDKLTVMGDPRTIQRFEQTGIFVKDFPSISDMALAPSPTQMENPELTSTRIEEFIVNGIIDGNIAETYPAYLEAWMDDGGAQIIQEVNEWYSSMK